MLLSRLPRHARAFSSAVARSAATADGASAIAPLRCDASFIDGAKTFAGRLAHVHSLRRVSPPRAKVFLDEVSTVRRPPPLRSLV